MSNFFDFLLNPIRRGVGGVRRGIGALEDQINPTRRQPMPPGTDVNPAELDQVRRALPPSWNGTSNPATQPRPVAPNPNAPTMSDRPAMPVNTRPRQVMPPLDGPAVETPVMERPTATRPRFATPYKAAENEYVGEHGKRGWKEALKGGLYGMAMSGGRGDLGSLIGGFAGGALGQTIAPGQMAQARFAMGPGRQILEDQKMQRDDELYGLKVRGQEAQIEENRQQAEAAARRDVFHNVPRNNSVIDTTGRQVYQAPQTPVAPPAISPVTLDINGVPTVVDGRTGKPLGKAYIKPGDDTGLMNVPAGGAVFSKKDGRVLYQNPGKEAQVTPAETRQRTENASREVQAHNKLRQMVIEKGNQIAVLKGEGDPEKKISVLSAEYNALKQQFDAESDRIRTTYADDLEDVGQGGWSFFKAKPRPAGQSARPVMPSGNGSAKRSSVPRAWVREYAQENGISEQQAEAIFARKYNIHD